MKETKARADRTAAVARLRAAGGTIAALLEDGGRVKVTVVSVPLDKWGPLDVGRVGLIAAQKHPVCRLTRLVHEEKLFVSVFEERHNPDIAEYVDFRVAELIERALAAQRGASRRASSMFRYAVARLRTLSERVPFRDPWIRDPMWHFVFGAWWRRDRAAAAAHLAAFGG